MERKKHYRTMQPTFPFDHLEPFVPTEVWIQAMLEAQQEALRVTKGMEKGWGKVELFWVTYNFAFRQYIERWTKEHGQESNI